MGLKEYKVTIRGTETTLKLSDEDARREGLLKSEPEQKAAPKPANKARSASNKSK